MHFNSTWVRDYTTADAGHTNLKETLGSSTTSMHNPLRNALPVKLCKLLDQVVVFQQHRACNQQTGKCLGRKCQMGVL